MDRNADSETLAHYIYSLAVEKEPGSLQIEVEGLQNGKPFAIAPSLLLLPASRWLAEKLLAEDLLAKAKDVAHHTLNHLYQSQSRLVGVYLASTPMAEQDTTYPSTIRSEHVVGYRVFDSATRAGGRLYKLAREKATPADESASTEAAVAE
jgi:hypothetical protein